MWQHEVYLLCGEFITHNLVIWLEFESLEYSWLSIAFTNIVIIFCGKQFIKFLLHPILMIAITHLFLIDRFGSLWALDITPGSGLKIGIINYLWQGRIIKLYLKFMNRQGCSLIVKQVIQSNLRNLREISLIWRFIVLIKDIWECGHESVDC